MQYDDDSTTGEEQSFKLNEGEEEEGFIDDIDDLEPDEINDLGPIEEEDGMAKEEF